MSFLRPSAAHRLQQLHHSSNKLKQCSSIWGTESAGVAQKNFSRNCLAAMFFYLISSENLVTFDAVSASQFSFSLPGPRWMWAQQKKRKKEQGKGPIHFYYFLLRCVKPMCLYMSLYCVPSRDGGDLSAFTRELKWENTVPSPPLLYPISIKSMTVQLLARRRRCGECHIRL